MVTGLLYQTYPYRKNMKINLASLLLKKYIVHAAPTKVFKKPQAVVTKCQVPTSILLL